MPEFHLGIVTEAMFIRHRVALGETLTMPGDEGAQWTSMKRLRLSTNPQMAGIPTPDICCRAEHGFYVCSDGAKWARLATAVTLTITP